MPYYDQTGQTTPERDQTILDLRKRGYTYRAIAKKVGMSPRGAQQVIERLQTGRPGRDPRP
jgi:lambda repressor-like predicted transcriptional regulator